MTRNVDRGGVSRRQILEHIAAINDEASLAEAEVARMSDAVAIGRSRPLRRAAVDASERIRMEALKREKKRQHCSAMGPDYPKINPSSCWTMMTTLKLRSRQA